MPAGKAFGANWLLKKLDKRATAVIPPGPNRKHQRGNDTDACKWRHLVGNFCSKTKGFRGIATRHDKTHSSYAANWNRAADRIAPR